MKKLVLTVALLLSTSALVQASILLPNGQVLSGAVRNGGGIWGTPVERNFPVSDKPVRLKPAQPSEALPGYGLSPAIRRPNQNELVEHQPRNGDIRTVEYSPGGRAADSLIRERYEDGQWKEVPMNVTPLSITPTNNHFKLECAEHEELLNKVNEILQIVTELKNTEQKNRK